MITITKCLFPNGKYTLNLFPSQRDTSQNMKSSFRISTPPGKTSGFPARLTSGMTEKHGIR
ncbi:MAG TPA: hypothetical protein DCO82_04085 [Alphaproteobacteria bacterium]|nr:hypothetical protein [Alphaproteobacteria bacterium]